MPARRPYASRGVPRRASTRRTGDGSPLLGILVLLIAIGLIPVGVWYFHPFEAQIDIPVLRSAQPAVIEPALQPLPTTAATVQAQVANTSLPVATPPPTTRKWSSGGDGIQFDPVLASLLDQALLGVDG